MTLINFFVRGACVEEQTVTSCFAGRSLTLAELKTLFPFEGDFLFRQKVDGHALDIPDLEYAWLDLCDDKQRISTFGDSVDITAVALSIPDSADGRVAREFSEHYEFLSKDLANNGMSPRDRPMRQTLKSQPKTTEDSSSHIRNLSMNNVSKAASSIWSSVVSTASTLHSQVLSQSSTLSDASQKVLNFLSSELSTPFDDSQPGHVRRLQDIWDCVFPGESFQRVSAQWRLLGFQKADPTLDLKSSGVLPLLNVSFFCQQYSAQAQAMITAQKENKKSNYPFAIVCINLTLLLADVLGLREKKYLSDSSPYFQLFESELGFFELFSICLLHLDFLWTTRKAVRGDFGKIMTEIKKIVTNVLKRHPNSVQSLNEAASREGMQSMF